MAAVLSPQAELGRSIFFDASLSASGRMSCASCHSPGHAYGPPDGAAVRRGGPGLDRPGMRAVPSLRYVLNRTPVWSRPYAANPAEREMEREPPAGGFGWDGRFNTLQQQAAFPLLDPDEMANADAAAVAAKLSAAPYAARFRQVFGEHVFTRPRQAFARALDALARFELEDASFHPFSSRYDDYLDGRGTLTAQELRGLALFEDPNGGNCAACHPDRRGADGSHPLFTDYQFEALGVPRNPEIAANADPHWFDEGVCGPLRHDQTGAGNCGLFKTPGLRNAATRRVFFHNGRFHDLKEVLRFYARRDTNPRQWYPAATGAAGGQPGRGPPAGARAGAGAGEAAEQFDDLPPQHRGNVDTVDPPLNRTAGQAPVWSEADIDAVAAFLATLTDRDARMANP